MIEVFSVDCSRSLGQYPNFKAARTTLDKIAVAGHLGNVPKVMVCLYRRGEPVKEYVTTYLHGTWHRRRSRTTTRADTINAPN